MFWLIVTAAQKCRREGRGSDRTSSTAAAVVEHANPRNRERLAMRVEMAAIACGCSTGQRCASFAAIVQRGRIVMNRFSTRNTHVVVVNDLVGLDRVIRHGLAPSVPTGSYVRLALLPDVNQSAEDWERSLSRYAGACGCQAAAVALAPRNGRARPATSCSVSP